MLNKSMVFALVVAKTLQSYTFSVNYENYP